MMLTRLVQKKEMGYPANSNSNCIYIKRSQFQYWYERLQEERIRTNWYLSRFYPRFTPNLVFSLLVTSGCFNCNHDFDRKRLWTFSNGFGSSVGWKCWKRNAVNLWNESFVRSIGDEYFWNVFLNNVHRVFLNDLRIFQGINVHEAIMVGCYINCGPKMSRYENRKF